MSEAIALEGDALERSACAVAWLLPGIALLFVIGYAGKITEQVLSEYGTAHPQAEEARLRPFVVGALAELFITLVTLGLVVGEAAVFRL